MDQHFFARKRTKDMTGLMKLYPQYLGIGIDEGRHRRHGLHRRGDRQVEGGVLRLLDEARRRDGLHRSGGGETYDLKSRKKIEK